MKKIGVIGAGSWGTALAVTLANKGHQVKIWAHRAEHVEEMKSDRENVKYLPGVHFAETLQPVETLEEALKDADMALFSVPAQVFRATFEKAIPYLEDKTIVVNVAKGIERGTLMRLSEIATLLKPDVKYVVLSGPSHAEEVGKQMPTTVAVAADDIRMAEEVQDMFMTDRFRVYTNGDVCGTELGGALKNIIALGA
ncbi:MAG: NAD(P)-binding domain-containing protein, partial [Firmicutes bacterium]|nr:NAD(P)-binding domain-containing protein [Bacillota bacterium]